MSPELAVQAVALLRSLALYALQVDLDTAVLSVETAAASTIPFSVGNLHEV